MSTLYQLVADYRNAGLILADTDADPKLVADTLEAMAGDIEVKATNVAFVAQNLEAMADAREAAAKEMLSRARAEKARAKHLKDSILSAMQIAGIQKIECPQFTISTKNNPSAVDVYDTAQIPVSFMRQPETPPPEPDKKAISVALKCGEDVPGARLTQSQRLDIRR